jgi:predicted nucleotidyltransferase
MFIAQLDAEELKNSFPELRLLMLHGSRARAHAREDSDWDFAYLADSGLDELELRAALARTLQTDAVDVVDLERAGAVLRYQTARDGQVIVERNFGDGDRFRLAAIRFWLEIEPVLAESHRAVLEQLG